MANNIKEIVFDELVYEYQGIILKVCRTFFRQEADQQDLFQDIVIKLWNGYASFNHDSKISTWIYRISLNHAIDKSRKKKGSTEELSESVSNQKTSTADSSETEYDVEALYLAIDILKPLEKSIILLHMEKEPYKEIAKVIGISEKNVSVKLVGIKEKLKQFYLRITNSKIT